MKCIKCGTEIKEGNTFCTNCGTSIHAKLEAKDNHKVIKIKFSYFVVGIIAIAILIIAVIVISIFSPKSANMESSYVNDIGNHIFDEETEKMEVQLDEPSEDANIIDEQIDDENMVTNSIVENVTNTASVDENTDVTSNTDSSSNMGLGSSTVTNPDTDYKNDTEKHTEINISDITPGYYPDYENAKKQIEQRGLKVNEIIENEDVAFIYMNSKDKWEYPSDTGYLYEKGETVNIIHTIYVPAEATIRFRVNISAIIEKTQKVPLLSNSTNDMRCECLL